MGGWCGVGERDEEEWEKGKGKGKEGKEGKEGKKKDEQWNRKDNKKKHESQEITKVFTTTTHHHYHHPPPMLPFSSFDQGGQSIDDQLFRRTPALNGFTDSIRAAVPFQMTQFAHTGQHINRVTTVAITSNLFTQRHRGQSGVSWQRVVLETGDRR